MSGSLYRKKGTYTIIELKRQTMVNHEEGQPGDYLVIDEDGRTEIINLSELNQNYELSPPSPPWYPYYLDRPYFWNTNDSSKFTIERNTTGT